MLDTTNTETSFEISFSVRGDTGRYTLTLENEHGNFNASARITVLDRPAPPEKPLDVSNVSDLVTAKPRYGVSRENKFTKEEDHAVDTWATGANVHAALLSREELPIFSKDTRSPQSKSGEKYHSARILLREEIDERALRRRSSAYRSRSTQHEYRGDLCDRMVLDDRFSILLPAESFRSPASATRKIPLRLEEGALSHRVASHRQRLSAQLLARSFTL
ncbi:uncharacterized protein [Temnothorax nylanderi]|uniref:uncharacterized protein n=1 Tax=Temnothorax nylanderi TaxID=102681 RepID=UPI003A88F0C9